MKLNHLRILILGCFHEDWRLDASSHVDAIRQFVEREPANVVSAVLSELELLRAADPSESSLRGLIVGEWNSSYDPCSDGLTMREWLEEIWDALRKKGRA